jgi:hypothetical protein
VFWARFRRSPFSIPAFMRLVSLRTHTAGHEGSARNAIVIGFVGGLVKHDDLKHPEVHFAALLRAAYPPTIHAEVFANHEGKKALYRVLQLLDTNSDGVVSLSE